MFRRGWSFKAMNKGEMFLTIIIGVLAYSLVIVYVLTQSPLANPLWTPYQIILSITYFAAGIASLFLFFILGKRPIFALLFLFCILPSFHLFTTAGLWGDENTARQWYIYFSNISYYATFALFVFYLNERVRTNINPPIASLMTSIGISAGVVLTIYFNFFVNPHYLEDVWDGYLTSYYEPLYKADLQLVGAIAIILLVGIYWLFQLRKSSQMKWTINRAYLFMWIFALILAFGEAFNLFVGYRGYEIKTNFPVMIGANIFVNFYLIFYLVYRAIKCRPKTIRVKEKMSARKIKKLQIKKGDPILLKLVKWTADEGVRNLIVAFVALLLLFFVVCGKITAKAFLFYTMAVYFAVVIFIYYVLYPFLVDFLINRRSS